MVKQRMVKLHPATSPYAGQIVTRTARCTCGNLFSQTELNPEGLSGFTDGARASFLESCVVMKSGRIYTPRSCPRCERQKL